MLRIRGLVSVSFFLHALVSPGQENKVGEALYKRLNEGKYYGLFIGVEDYGDQSGIGDLNNPVKDAIALSEVLIRKYGFRAENVDVLNNPNRSDLIISLEELSSKVTTKDHVLIFYAGHGKWIKEIEQGYWLPSDSRIGTRSNWISNDDIRDLINLIPSKHTLLISDACFSGGLLRDAGESREMLALFIDKSRSALTSGNLETVPDNSIFMKYLLQKLVSSQA